MRFVIIFILFSIVSFGQNKELDAMKNDTLKVDKLNSIATSYWEKNWDSARVYTNLSYDLAKKLDDKRGMFINLINMGVYENISGDFKTSLEYFNKAKQFFPYIREKKKLANFHYNLGNLYLDFGKSEEALYNLRKASDLYKEINRMSSVANINLNISLLYTKKSDYKKSNEILFENVNYFTKIKDKKGLASTFNSIANNYGTIREFDKALEYAQKTEVIAKEINNPNLLALAYLNMGCAYGELNNYKLCEKTLLKSKEIYASSSYAIGVQKIEMNLCELYLRRKQFFKADSIANIVLKSKELLKYENDIINLNKMKGFTLFNLKSYKKALPFLKTAYYLSKKANNNVTITEIIPYLLNTKYKNNNDLEGEKLFAEYDSITKLKNITENREMFFKLDTQFKTSEKDTQIHNQHIELKYRQLELEKEKTNKYIAFAGIGFLLLLSTGGFIFYRNKQKQKELQTQNTLLGLQQNINAMELQNLNQQLNPHEIKNLLASISPEIQEKAPESYRKMLKLFNITKASLNSNSITDTVENQVQQIEDFLSLEKNTLTEPLDYEIENNINNNRLKIPRLMLKNLIENSVKHGIKGKESGGKIKVELQEKDNFIYITVDDTGKGRQNAISLDSGIGTTTYQKLFATLNQINKENATFEIIDKELGTKVVVKIPTNYKYS